METTLNYKGIDFDVEYTYLAEEKMVMYYPDGSGYPGSPAEVEINEIKHKGDCFFEVLEDNIEEISNLILEQHESKEF